MIGAGGKVTVTTSGTPVAALPAAILPNFKDQAIHGIMVQQITGNTGKIYIGRQGMNISTLAGVYAVLPTPTAGFLPTFSAAVTIAPNALGSVEFWIDADINGEGALVTFLQL